MRAWAGMSARFRPGTLQRGAFRPKCTPARQPRWSRGAPTVCGPSSLKAAAVRHAAGPRKAVACASRRTRATGQPRAMSASALGPATAVAAMAATGGSRLTCAGEGKISPTLSGGGALHSARRCAMRLH